MLKVTNTADPTGDITYSYDSENRITEKTVAAKTPVTIKYEYDKKAGNAGEHYTIITDSKGGKVVETYDKMGRLISVNDGKDETKYTYLADGTKSSTIFSDNSRETYIYNKNSQLITLNHIDAAGKTIAVYSYKYDNNKNVISKVDNKGTTSYVYDSLNRLLQVTEPDKTITAYKYDKAGNRANESVTKDGKTLEKAYYYDIENRLIKTIDCLTGVKLETNYTFDANGNQITEITKDFSSGKVLKNREIIYDQYNRVIEISENGKVLEKNTYNYEGLRVTKETDNKKVLYIYDGKNVLLELDSLGNVLARNVFGTKLISREVTGNLKGFYRYNGHGDVVKIVDKSGKVLVEYYYDAFGTLKECIGNFDNPYRYSGYIYDEEAKYYYLQSRMYDPLLGRFIQEDSYRGDEKDPLSLNLYTYCLNNPMIYDDQNGHWPSVLSKIGSAISSAAHYVSSGISWAYNKISSGISWAYNKVKEGVSWAYNKVKEGVSWAYNKVKEGVSWAYNKVKSGVSRGYNKVVSKTKQYVKATVSAAQRAYNYTKTQMNKAIQAIKKIDVSKLAVGALNLIQGGAAIALGVSLTAICPPAGVGLVALGAGTALIGFGQAADAVVHEDPVRNFANNLGISNKAYDTASEVVPLLTSLGCMAATSVLSFSALRSGARAATSTLDTAANMTEHATEAEERVISYETDAYSVYTKGSYNKAPKPNCGPLARDVAGDNRAAALRGMTKAERLKQNRVNGRKFELEALGKMKENADDVVEQITIKSKSGTRTRLDAIGRDKETGEILIQEYKASSKAPLTRNQKIAHPEIETDGGIIVGKGKPPFIGGTEIPPTKIEIIRKK